MANYYRNGGSQSKNAELYKTTIAVWAAVILLSSIVFHFGVHANIYDAILESAAAWTGTGISVFDSNTTAVWLQLFRSVCNWIGGVGIIMTALVFIKPRRFLGWMLAATEFPGPYYLKSENDFRRYYRRIPLIYAALTALQFVLLLVAGMDPVRAVMTALSNSSSAGLHHINNGFAAALPIKIKAVITLFAFLSSIYSPLFILMIRRKRTSIKNSSELRLYIGRILIATVIISAVIMKRTPGAAALKSAASVFAQVISSFSTSGYVISDVSSWPAGCLIVITIMGFAGACSLSTGGGFKTGRLCIALKMIAYSLYKQVHPNSIKNLRYDKKPLKSEAVVSANVFIALFMITYLLGALLLSLDNISLGDALSYSQAMLTGSGIPLISQDATGLASGFSPYGKIILSALMIAGRLEIYPLMMLFLRSFWRADSSL